MQIAYLGTRAHLKPLAARMRSLLELAAEMYPRGRAVGQDVAYAEFEPTVAKQAADIERGVHEVALAGLDVDVPTIR